MSRMKDSDKKNTVDMLHGPLAGKLIRFAVPIALSSMLQLLFNAADTSVVGKFADSGALAAVGTNSEIVSLFVTLASGISVGVNVLLARAIGENKRQEISPALHSSLVLAVLIGIIGTAVGLAVSRPLLVAIQTPAEVLEDAVAYFRIYLLSYPFIVIYDFGAAALRSQGDSRRPFIALIIAGVLNVILNLFFVIVCHAGVAGVSIATDISNVFSALIVMIWLAKEKNEFRFSMRLLKLRRTDVSSILKIGIPSAIQGSVFSFANIFVQSSVNSFGAVETAGNTISLTFECFAYYIVVAFGQAATTFTGQNYAAGNEKRCRTILKQCMLFSFVFSAIFILPIILWRHFFIGLFTSDPDVMESAARRMMMLLTLQAICGFYEVPAGSLRGAGHSTLPAVITTIFTCGLRILWLFTVFRHFHTYLTLYGIFPINWVITSIAMNLAIVILHPFRESSQKSTRA